MRAGFVGRRLAQVLPTVAGIVVAGFVLIHLTPGDPVLAVAGEHGDAAYYEDMRARFGLNEPLPRRLATYGARVLTGDFGFSYVHGRSTADVVLEHVPATLVLTGSALLLALCLAIPLGVAAARRPHGWRDLGITGTAVGLYSMPVYWIAQMALIVFAGWLGMFPVHGMGSAGVGDGLAARGLDVLRHLALPALVLASQELAVFTRLTRAGMLDELGRDHVRTARAKGVSELAVVVRHVLPRAMIPVVALIGTRAGYLLAGAVIVEVVFGWPGMGRLLLAAIQTRDAPVLLGIFFAVAFAVVLANLLADLVHAAIDPRVRRA